MENMFCIPLQHSFRARTKVSHEKHRLIFVEQSQKGAERVLVFFTVVKVAECSECLFPPLVGLCHHSTVGAVYFAGSVHQQSRFLSVLGDLRLRDSGGVSKSLCEAEIVIACEFCKEESHLLANVMIMDDNGESQFGIGKSAVNASFSVPG